MPNVGKRFATEQGLVAKGCMKNSENPSISCYGINKYSQNFFAGCTFNRLKYADCLAYFYVVVNTSHVLTKEYRGEYQIALTTQVVKVRKTMKEFEPRMYRKLKNSKVTIEYNNACVSNG